MNERELLLEQVEALAKTGGKWSSDIPLPFDVWTRGNLNVPHTRLKRLLQTAHELAPKPLAECRVLDLGCLEGQFSIEFALQGATVVGVEVRGASVRKAEFCRDALGLDKLTFVEDDVRNVSLAKLGQFDIILCSGILYHLPADDVFRMAVTLYEMTTRLVLIDTHVSLEGQVRVDRDGRTYCGSVFREHDESATQEQRAQNMWASWDNTTSFWLTRPSLVNLLVDAGFPSVHEIFSSPPRANESGLERGDRCTLAALKSQVPKVRTCPAADAVSLRWSEQDLAYAPGRRR
jgi:SAM-dependent methyltransferase